MTAVNRKSLVVLLNCQSASKQEYFLGIMGMTWGDETGQGRNRTNNILPFFMLVHTPLLSLVVERARHFVGMMLWTHFPLSYSLFLKVAKLLILGDSLF